MLFALRAGFTKRKLPGCVKIETICQLFTCKLLESAYSKMPKALVPNILLCVRFLSKGSSFVVRLVVELIEASYLSSFGNHLMLFV